MSDLADLLRGALAPAHPDPPLPPGVPAAVVVPLVDGPEPSLLLTRRTHLVRDHKGEISFPGGVRHLDDPDLLTTALRETEEELGIPADRFDVLGALPPIDTVVTGYAVVPFVGRLAEMPPLAPSAVEIDEVIRLDLARLAAVEREVVAAGSGRGWFAYEVDGHLVWGATGRMVHSLLRVLRAEGWLS